LSDNKKHDELEALRANAVEVIRRGRGSRPDVMRVRWNGGQAILKDQNGCDEMFARLVGPLLARREARALERLRSLEGIPALLGHPDKRAIVMEYIPATPLTRAEHRDWAAFFTSLESLIDAMHASPNNTLVGPAGEPVLVDFVASVRRGASWNLPSRWLFAVFRRVDIKAVIKLKSIVAPELIEPEQRHLVEHRSPLHRAVRRVGIMVRQVTRRLFTRSV
jgi:hypothetical protein